MKADTIFLKQAQDKRGIAESLQVSINRARLTVCEVGVSSREKKSMPGTWE